MKTVPTLCATSTGIGLSALGFVLARPDHDNPPRRSGSNTFLHPPPPPPRQTSSVDPGGSRPLSSVGAPSLAPSGDMTLTATCTVQTVDTYATPTSFCSPFGFSARQSLRSARIKSGVPSRNAPDHARATLKKRDGQTMPRGADPSVRDSAEASPPISPSFPPQQQPSWLKRLSLSSRDSTQYSSSRPNSSVVSVAPSASGSTTPMIPSQTPPTASVPNKLVKRSMSLSKGSAPAQLSDSNSKLPVLKRPATSHRRSATLQEKRTTAVPKAENAFRRSLNASLSESVDQPQWRSFFTPRMAAGPSASSRRRNSTGIPNPIKRVYPDRKYRPVLLSARENVNAAAIELDIDAEGDSEHVTNPRMVSDLQVTGRYYSSSSPHVRPATVSVPTSSNRFSRATVDFPSASYGSSARIDEVKGFEEEDDEDQDIEDSRSSFSISDIIPDNSHSWKQPPPVQRPMAKYRRRGTRTSSSTPPSMGNSQSLSNDESEPIAKHRDLNNVAHASASPSVSSPLTQIDLNLSSHAPQSSSAALPAGARLPYRQGLSFVEPGAVPSPTSSSALRPSHQPVPYSDFPANLAGSDSELRSGDDEGLDSQSDTIYDSVRTRAPKSSPGRRGPPIETIFGESPPFHIHGKHTMLRDFLQQGPLHDHGYSLKPRHSIIHEEDAISTPVRSARQQPLATSSPAFPMRSSPMATNIASSPPAMPSLSDLRQHAQRFPDADADDDEESSWSFGDDEDEQEALPIKNRFAHLGITPDLLSPYGKQSSSSAATTPQRPIPNQDRDTRSSIFDWSEQQPMDKSPSNRSPPRPKTVHGKKDAESRGSRSVGRRAPSGMHTRSQSVPVAQDADGKRQGTNKFGTWGIGSKGVTEDWNEDFDFSDTVEEKRLDSGVSMFVPKSIRDQQTNVLANIGLLRDWGLLIEELKELKVRAAALDVLGGENGKMWSEVDAMIDLADQESDEQTLAPRFSPPSSPSFNYEDFDEPLPAPPTAIKLAPGARLTLPESPSDIGLGMWSDEEAVSSPSRTENGILITPATPRRPRKNSEAVARSVIEALQQKRIASDPGPATEGRDKVHFDTATLKRIIPYVQELRDRVKKVIRNAEDLLPSPKSFGSIGSNGSRSVRRRLRDTQESPTLRRRSRRSTNAAQHTSPDEGLHSPTEELSARLRLMAMT